MPKIKLRKSFYWPFYELSDYGAIEVLVSEELLAQWLKVSEEMETIQAHFSKLARWHDLQTVKAELDKRRQWLKRAAQYVKNTTGGASRAHFIEDHGSLGELLWADLIKAALVYEDTNGRFRLTDGGRRLLKTRR